MRLVSAALHVQRKEAWQQWHLHSHASSSHMAMPSNQPVLSASACDISLAYASCKPRLAVLQVPVEKKRKDYAFQRQFNEKPSIIPGCPVQVPVYTLQVSLHALQFCLVPCIASQPNTYTA